jgi:hypothetical protein
LGPDASCSHNAVHAVLPARLALVFHVQRDVSIAIGKSTFNPKLFDLSEQALVFNGPLALGLLESCLYERVFLFDSLAKYTAASFNIFRSSVTRRS